MKDKNPEIFQRTVQGNAMVLTGGGETPASRFLRCRVERVTEEAVIFDLLVNGSRLIVAMTPDEYLAVASMMKEYAATVGRVDEIRAEDLHGNVDSVN
jgi:hypothetical protein